MFIVAIKAVVKTLFVVWSGVSWMKHFFLSLSHSIYLSVYLSIYFSLTRRYIYISNSQYLFVSIYLPIYLYLSIVSVCQSINLPIYPICPLKTTRLNDRHDLNIRTAFQVLPRQTHFKCKHTYNKYIMCIFMNLNIYLYLLICFP